MRIVVSVMRIAMRVVACLLSFAVGTLGAKFMLEVGWGWSATIGTGFAIGTAVAVSLGFRREAAPWALGLGACCSVVVAAMGVLAGDARIVIPAAATAVLGTIGFLVTRRRPQSG